MPSKLRVGGTVLYDYLKTCSMFTVENYKWFTFSASLKKIIKKIASPMFALYPASNHLTAANRCILSDFKLLSLNEISDR